MSFSEFSYAMNQYQESTFFKLGKKLVELQSQEDLEGLKNTLKLSTSLLLMGKTIKLPLRNLVSLTSKSFWDAQV